MTDHAGSRLADAAAALLAGRPLEARARYEACRADVPHLAALGQALAAWLQQDFPAVRGQIALALAAAPATGFPHGLALALDGLARIHGGEPKAGLARQLEGLAVARAAADGSELNVQVALAEGLVHLGRWAEARATIAGVRAGLEAGGAPLTEALLDRLELALAVLTDTEAAERTQAAVPAARAAGSEVDLARALRWRGAWLATHRPEDAVPCLEEAVALAVRTGQPLPAAEALMLLAGLGGERAKLLASARQQARASGSLAAEIAVGLQMGGAAAREATQRQAAVLAGLSPDERAAYLAWPGRTPAAPGVDPAALARLGEMLTAISAQPDLAGVLRTALSCFVAVAEAERGFLLRLDGFEVLDQVIQGAVPDAYSTSLADRVVWSGEPLVAEDLETEGDLGASVQELGIRMALGMPLLAQGQVIGVILADGGRAHPGFGPETLTLARALADHVVAAIAAAERDRQHRANEGVQAALARAALAAAGAADLDAALPAIAREAATGLGAERVFVCLGPSLDCKAALDGQGRELADARPSRGAIAWVAEQGRPLVVVDARVDEAFAGRPSVQELGLQAIQAAPLVHDGRVAGVLYLDSREPGQPAPGLLEGLAAIVAALLGRQAQALRR